MKEFYAVYCEDVIDSRRDLEATFQAKSLRAAKHKATLESGVKGRWQQISTQEWVKTDGLECLYLWEEA